MDTGENTMTGGRLKRVQPYLDGDDFCFTYGDGLSNVNISELVAFHKNQGTYATVTGVQPPGRYGLLKVDESNIVSSFQEKPEGDGGWVNGGFFVLSPKVFDYIDGDHNIWERGPMEKLATEGQLSVYHHLGFWHPMDKLYDKKLLEGLWDEGKAPWKIWDTLDPSRLRAANQ